MRKPERYTVRFSYRFRRPNGVNALARTERAPAGHARASRVWSILWRHPTVVCAVGLSLVYSLHRLGTAHNATRLHGVMAPHAHHAAARPLARPLWVRHGGPVGHTRRTDCTRLYRLCHAIESRPPTITSACR